MPLVKGWWKLCPHSLRWKQQSFPLSLFTAALTHFGTTFGNQLEMTLRLLLWSFFVWRLFLWLLDLLLI